MSKQHEENTQDEVNVMGSGPHEKEPGWHDPLPLKLPEPGPWPALLAFGTTLLAFGVVTAWAFTVVGLVFFVVGLAGWIERLRHE